MSNEVVSEELAFIKSNLTSLVGDIDLIACHQNLVSIRIKKTKHREVIACIQFPESYPHNILLIEIKSKVFPPVLNSNINQICDQELKKCIGQTQILFLTKFLRKFIDENPLLPCRDEIAQAKKEVFQDCDVVKMKQKQGKINIHAKKNKYFFKFSIAVPDEYPVTRTVLEVEGTNFPSTMAYYFISQAREFARQAVEPPLRKSNKQPAFVPSPQVFKVVKFIVKDCVKRYPVENCPICEKPTLPSEPNAVVTGVKEDNYAERVFCGCLFHHGCLDKYMKTPPFTGGKKCPVCRSRIYHDKWNIPPKLAEDRWAHKEAKKRELDDVIDAFS